MSALQISLWDNIPEEKWRDFKKAREFVRNLKLSDINEWSRYISGEYNDLISLPEDIPEDPDVQYRHSGWKNWEDWLGIESAQINKTNPLQSIWDLKEKSKWLPFNEAREVIWKYGFEYEEEWDLYILGKFPTRQSLPDNIPENPDKIYRFEGWKGWKDWLIPMEKRKEYTSFSKARDFVRCLKLKDVVAWRDYILKGEATHEKYNIVLPDKPDLEYLDKGWESWENWLGTKISFKNFSTTRQFVISLKLRNKTEWDKYCNNQLPGKKPKPENIFSYPEIAYKDEGWKGWDYWSGSEHKQENHNIKRSAVEMKECRCKGRIKDCPECDGKGYIMNYK